MDSEVAVRSEYALEGRHVALVDLLDRVLQGGVVISGDIELSIADVPLVRVSLRAVVASVVALAPDSDSADSATQPEAWWLE